MKRAVLVAGLLVVMFSGAGYSQDAVMAGTWKANVSKSGYVPGAAPKNETLRVELLGERFKVSLDGINQQGPYHSVATPPRHAHFTYAFRRIDGLTWEIVIKVNGAPWLVVRNVMSADGQTMTATSTVVGRGVVNQVVVYEKQ